MRNYMLALLLPFAMFQQSCNPSAIGADPEQIRVKFQQVLVPYFPNAKVQVIPNQQIILAFSCTKGTGPGLTQQVAAFVQNNPSIGDLRKLRMFGAIFNAATYRYVAIGFENEVVRYDVDNGDIGTVPIDSQYRQSYNYVCGFSDVLGPETPNTGYIWVGQFHVTFALPFQGRYSAETFDTLGLYNSNEFTAQSDTEIQQRIAIIRQNLTARGASVSDVKFVHANKIFPPAASFEQQYVPEPVYGWKDVVKQKFMVDSGVKVYGPFKAGTTLRLKVKSPTPMLVAALSPLDTEAFRSHPGNTSVLARSRCKETGVRDNDWKCSWDPLDGDMQIVLMPERSAFNTKKASLTISTYGCVSNCGN